MEPLESEQKPSRRLLWVGIALVVAVVAIIGAVSYLMVANTKKDTGTISSSPSPSQTVASKEEVSQNLSTLNDSLKQATKDQDAAKAAIKESANQPKIGN